VIPRDLCRPSLHRRLAIGLARGSGPGGSQTPNRTRRVVADKRVRENKVTGGFTLHTRVRVTRARDDPGPTRRRGADRRRRARTAAFPAGSPEPSLSDRPTCKVNTSLQNVSGQPVHVMGGFFFPTRSADASKEPLCPLPSASFCIHRPSLSTCQAQKIE
jgi:hypothetical protein